MGDTLLLIGKCDQLKASVATDVSSYCYSSSSAIYVISSKFTLCIYSIYAGGDISMGLLRITYKQDLFIDPQQ